MSIPNQVDGHGFHTRPGASPISSRYMAPYVEECDTPNSPSGSFSPTSSYYSLTILRDSGYLHQGDVYNSIQCSGDPEQFVPFFASREDMQSLLERVRMLEAAASTDDHVQSGNLPSCATVVEDWLSQVASKWDYMGEQRSTLSSDSADTAILDVDNLQEALQQSENQRIELLKKARSLECRMQREERKKSFLQEELRLARKQRDDAFASARDSEWHEDFQERTRPLHLRWAAPPVNTSSCDALHERLGREKERAEAESQHEDISRFGSANGRWRTRSPSPACGTISPY